MRDKFGPLPGQVQVRAGKNDTFYKAGQDKGRRQALPVPLRSGYESWVILGKGGEVGEDRFINLGLACRGDPRQTVSRAS